VAGPTFSTVLTLYALKVRELHQILSAGKNQTPEGRRPPRVLMIAFLRIRTGY
jgi:hypothetical protein